MEHREGAKKAQRGILFYSEALVSPLRPGKKYAPRSDREMTSNKSTIVANMSLCVGGNCFRAIGTYRAIGCHPLELAQDGGWLLALAHCAVDDDRVRGSLRGAARDPAKVLCRPASSACRRQQSTVVLQTTAQHGFRRRHNVPAAAVVPSERPASTSARPTRRHQPWERRLR